MAGISLLAFTRKPHRAINVRPAADQWEARFVGDEWTARFRTQCGPLPLVLDALKYRDEGRGLPIVVRNADVEW